MICKPKKLKIKRKNGKGGLSEAKQQISLFINLITKNDERADTAAAFQRLDEPKKVRQITSPSLRTYRHQRLKNC